MDSVIKKKKLSFLEFTATVLSCSSLVCQVVSLSTNHWASTSKYNIGLWVACSIPTGGGEGSCSRQQLYDVVDNKGKQWTLAPEVLFVVALVVWVFEVLLFLKLTCTTLTARSRETLTGVSLGLMMIAGTCLLVGCLVFATGTQGIPGRTLSWSFALACLALCLSVISAIMIAISEHRMSGPTAFACAELCRST